MQNIAGHCQQTFENKKFVDITQQCFALLLQVNFPANNLNFNWRWRWWDQIKDIFLNLFYLIPYKLCDTDNICTVKKLKLFEQFCCQYPKINYLGVGASNISDATSDAARDSWSFSASTSSPVIWIKLFLL